MSVILLWIEQGRASNQEIIFFVSFPVSKFSEDIERYYREPKAT